MPSSSSPFLLLVFWVIWHLVIRFLLCDSSHFSSTAPASRLECLAFISEFFPRDNSFSTRLLGHPTLFFLSHSLMVAVRKEVTRSPSQYSPGKGYYTHIVLFSW